jgi:hypothetical protein
MIIVRIDVMDGNSNGGPFRLPISTRITLGRHPISRQFVAVIIRCTGGISSGATIFSIGLSAIPDISGIVGPVWLPV